MMRRVALWFIYAALYGLSVLVIFAAVQAREPVPGPKAVPTCEDNGALRVRVQMTTQDWVLCYHAATQRIIAVPESQIGALP